MIHRKTSEELLGESIIELSRNKPLDKITVKEIAENCGLSSATFYRNFQDKYELISWIYNYQVEYILEEYKSGEEDWKQVLLDCAAVLDKERSFYRNAFRNTEGPNSFFLSIHRHVVELLSAILREKDPLRFTPEVEFDIRFYLQGISWSITEWFMNGYPSEMDRLAEYLYNSMPAKLKEFLQ